ncbi:MULTISPECIES: hypothetical protein [Bacillus]
MIAFASLVVSIIKDKK